MSFEIYVQVFGNEEPIGLSIEEISQSFGEYLSKVSPTLWKVQYDSENTSDIYIHGDGLEDSRINSFTIYRPCIDIRLWNSLFEIMGLGHVALCLPGSRVLLRNEVSLSYLPPDMINALGGYLIVKDTEQILNEVSTT
jgi:hypothetical protein